MFIVNLKKWHKYNFKVMLLNAKFTIDSLTKRLFACIEISLKSKKNGRVLSVVNDGAVLVLYKVRVTRGGSHDGQGLHGLAGPEGEPVIGVDVEASAHGFFVGRTQNANHFSA